MKVLLNVLMVLSVLAVWVSFPTLAIWIVVQNEWTWWLSALVIAAGVLLSPLAAVGYMMLLGTAVFWQSFREGFSGECSRSICTSNP